MAQRTNYKDAKCVKCNSKHPAGNNTQKRVQPVHKYHEVFFSDEMTDYLAGVFSDSLNKICFQSSALMLIKSTVDVTTLRFGRTVCVHVEELLIFSKARDKDWYAQGLVYGCNLQMRMKGSISNLTDIKKI